MEIQYGTQALTEFLAARHQIVWGAARTEANTQKARQQNGVSDDTATKGPSPDQSNSADSSDGVYDIARN
jgi:hypothetical protein